MLNDVANVAAKLPTGRFMKELLSEKPKIIPARFHLDMLSG